MMAHGAPIVRCVAWALCATLMWTSHALAIAGTGTVPAGHAEIELKSRYAQNPTNEASRLAGILSVGIAPNFQATVESRLLLVEPDAAAPRGGFGDTFVELKYRLRGLRFA